MTKKSYLFKGYLFCFFRFDLGQFACRIKQERGSERSDDMQQSTTGWNWTWAAAGDTV